ncbi:hypothetical protein GCM10010435_95570 [Winogradskya consettensis]
MRQPDQQHARDRGRPGDPGGQLTARRPGKPGGQLTARRPGKPGGQLTARRPGVSGGQLTVTPSATRSHTAAGNEWPIAG